MHAGYSYSVFSEPITPLYQHWNIHKITHFTSEIMLGFEYFKQYSWTLLNPAPQCIEYFQVILSPSMNYS